ncbi:hypothetical protein PAMP_004907 [Pampus punctatissimus]
MAGSRSRKQLHPTLRQLCVHWSRELFVSTSRSSGPIGAAYPTRGGYVTAAPHCDWSIELSVFLHKDVTVFTWKPTASAGV